MIFYDHEIFASIISKLMISVLVAACAIINIKKPAVIIKRFFTAINRSCSNFFKQLGKLLKILFVIAVVLIILMIFNASYIICNSRLHFEKQILIIGVSIVTVIITSLLLYLIAGFFLTLLDKAVSEIASVNNLKISTNMMLSFILLLFLGMLFFLAPNTIKESNIFIAVALSVCYLINMYIILKIINNPMCLADGGYVNHIHIIICSLMVLFMIIANLYLFVLWSFYSFDGAYASNNCGESLNAFSMFYYTIISFTTVGYGDIYPNILASRIISILISVTSVICLIVFISTILSVKDDIYKNGVNNEKDNKRKYVRKGLSKIQ